MAGHIQIELASRDLIEIEVGREDGLTPTRRPGEDRAHRIDDAAAPGDERLIIRWRRDRVIDGKVRSTGELVGREHEAAARPYTGALPSQRDTRVPYLAANDGARAEFRRFATRCEGDAMDREQSARLHHPAIVSGPGAAVMRCGLVAVGPHRRNANSTPWSVSVVGARDVTPSQTSRRVRPRMPLPRRRSCHRPKPSSFYG